MMLQKYRVEIPKKNKINKRGDFLNEWGGFFNEWFFVKKNFQRKFVVLKNVVLLSPCDYPASR